MVKNFEFNIFGPNSVIEAGAKRRKPHKGTFFYINAMFNSACFVIYYS